MPENRYDNRVERFHSLSAENQPNGITFELLQPMLMLSPLGYVITAMNGKGTRIVFVNRSFEKITGYETNEVIGHNWQFLFRDDHHQASLRRFLEAVEQKRQYTEVVHNCRKDGSLSYTELTVYPILDSYGENIYFIWILRDVTFSIESEKKLTRKLAEKDKRFSAYMKHSNEALWCLAFDPPIPLDDPQADQVKAVFDRGVFTEANDAAARAYGLEKGIDLQGRPLKYHMDISASDNLKVISSLVQNRFLMENVMTHEKGVDESDVIAMNNITPRITNGAVTHVWGASLVITELSIAQKDLQQSKNELAAKSKALEEKNIALKELVAHIGLEQKDFKDRLMTNIKEIALPSLERIKLNKGEEAYIDLHRKDLENLASSFGLKVNDIRIKLTPREMEVCNLVRNGLANKEIAEILKIAVHTVEKHRRMARKKLGLNRKNVNLHSYLNSL